MAVDNCFIKPQLNESIGNDAVQERLYTCSAMEATNLKIVYTVDDLNADCTKRLFKPALVHQVFGVNEVIFGYNDLHVNIYVAPNSAQYYVEVNYNSIIDSSKGIPADNIIEKLSSWLPSKYYTNKNQFIRVLGREDHSKIFGTVVDSFEAYNKFEDKTYKYTVTKCSVSEPGFSEFHMRFECMVVWFIDAASQIDMDDPNWIFLYVYEERVLTDGKVGYYPVGYCTVYKFFHFPDKIRARISQLFVIPPCQRAGVGTKLLNATYTVITDLPNVIDITVEDPCEAFTKMRDILDAYLLMQLDSFKPLNIAKGFTQQMYNEVNHRYKINKRQCHRIYKMLCMFYAIENSESKDFRNYYDEIRQHIEQAKACNLAT